jgi:arylsulfatase
MIGKWHLGSTDEFMPWNHGFDEFFGVPYSNDEKNFFVWDGRRRLPEAVDHTQLTRRYTDRALAFLDRVAQEERPFFLYFAPNAPHVPLDPGAGFAGRSRRGTYGDVVQELDAAVGELLDRLAALGVDDRTLVVFSSDNGPWRAMRDWGGSAGDLRGGKTGTFEGGHRVPALARWPGTIPPAREARALADMMDWLPTLAELAGASVPADRIVDGRSLTAVLRGTGEREATPFFYLSLRVPLLGAERHAVGAVRDGRWKLKLPKRGYPAFLEPWVRLEFDRHGLLLFDLEADRSEQHDVSAQHPDVVARLRAEIERFEAAGGFAERPVRIDAAPRDSRGWDRLGHDVAILFGVAFAAAASILFAAIFVVRRAVRRRR